MKRQYLHDDNLKLAFSPEGFAANEEFLRQAKFKLRINCIVLIVSVFVLLLGSIFSGSNISSGAATDFPSYIAYSLLLGIIVAVIYSIISIPTIIFIDIRRILKRRRDLSEFNNEYDRHYSSDEKVGMVIERTDPPALKR